MLLRCTDLNQRFSTDFAFSAKKYCFYVSFRQDLRHYGSHVRFSRFFIHSYRIDDVVIRASTSQSVDLGFIFLIESHQKTLKSSSHSFPAWRSAQKGWCGEQACKLVCCVYGQGTQWDASIFMWQIGGEGQDVYPSLWPRMTKDCTSSISSYARRRSRLFPVLEIS